MTNKYLYTTEIATETAKSLLEVEAVKIRPQDPFTWASGWKSPIYCDNRITLSFPKVRETITTDLATLIKSKYPEVECIAGVATAGIPQGALVAAKLGLPFIYVRSKPKGHGMTNLIEGKLIPNQKIIVLEDLISTGGSSIKAALDIRESGGNVIGLVAIFTYGFSVSEENFKNANIPYSCLSDYNSLLNYNASIGKLSQEELENLENWRKDPEKWGR